ncbi:type II toxin-antitoxin system PemK/MazF family toxin [Haloplasma contractile]|uniref:PemK-like protein n=1 Tax=Haloplasma contractile SSD-17B TaxID=1033810 RepID=U2EAD2_9MOLU|nr:type II toxin-antitoxin system PemK/MazF family toxin [Haloplasma contractile]ERJ12053.1 PemK-like protein [Haloplasma contractile SSD-17B]
MNTYVPGDIVYCHYFSFDDQDRKGYFLVLYNEALDNMHERTNNFTAIKITSKATLVDTYCQPLKQVVVPVLKTDSYALCSKVHTFDKSQVINYVGRVSEDVMKNVYKKVSRFLSEVNRQVLTYI